MMLDMNDTVIKSQRVSFKDLGINSMPDINNAYWEKKKAQQERWAKEDAEREAAKK